MWYAGRNRGAAPWFFNRGAIRELHRLPRSGLGGIPVSQTPVIFVANIPGNRPTIIRELHARLSRTERCRRKVPTMIIRAARANQMTQLKKFPRNLRRNVRRVFAVSQLVEKLKEDMTKRSNIIGMHPSGAWNMAMNL